MGELSFPIGRVEFEWMRPLSFGDFLQALDLNLLGEQFPDRSIRQPLPESIHLKLLRQVAIYAIVGGMPEAVVRYAVTRSLVEVARVHEALCLSLIQSLLRHNKRVNIECLEGLLEQMLRQVGRQLKYRNLDPERRIEQILMPPPSRSLIGFAGGLVLKLDQLGLNWYYWFTFVHQRGIYDDNQRIKSENQPFQVDRYGLSR